MQAVLGMSSWRRRQGGESLLRMARFGIKVEGMPARQWKQKIDQERRPHRYDPRDPARHGQSDDDVMDVHNYFREPRHQHKARPWDHKDDRDGRKDLHVDEDLHSMDGRNNRARHHGQSRRDRHVGQAFLEDRQYLRSRNRVDRKVRDFILENHVSKAFLQQHDFEYRFLQSDANSNSSAVDNGALNMDTSSPSSLDDKAMNGGGTSMPATDLTAFGLHDTLCEAIRTKAKVKAFFPIQALTFGELHAQKDVIARSKTGTGKTLAFVIAGLHKLMQGKANPQKQPQSASSDLKPTPPFSAAQPRILTVVPTRELALQVGAVFQDIGQPLGFRTVCCYGGGGAVSLDRQVKLLRHHVDIVVATPGRLEDLLNRKAVSLERVLLFVLDEADYMLDLGFRPAIDFFTGLLAANASPYQTCLFSATFPESFLLASLRYLKMPQRVFLDSVGSARESLVADTILQYAVPLASDVVDQLASSIRQLLLAFTSPDPSRQVLPKAMIFTNSKKQADLLADAFSFLRLKNKRYVVESLHGDIKQHQRERVLRSFRDNKVHCIICTDVAARGIDVPDVDLVIQIEPPQSPEAYIHRVGRTGRAGKSGTSVLFFLPHLHMHQMNTLTAVIKSKFKIFPDFLTPQDLQDLASSNPSLRQLLQFPDPS